jgi:hypothetical protein
MKQTAVEWLIEQLISKAMATYDTTTYNAIEQAKEMEKEQIRNAYNDGYFAAYKYKDWEEYYKQNFNQNK